MNVVIWIIKLFFVRLNFINYEKKKKLNINIRIFLKRVYKYYFEKS